MKKINIALLSACLVATGFAASTVRVELAGKSLNLDSVTVAGKT